MLAELESDYTLKKELEETLVKLTEKGDSEGRVTKIKQQLKFLADK